MKWLVDTLDGFGIPKMLTVPILSLCGFVIALEYFPKAVFAGFAVIMTLAPLWLPVVLGVVAWRLWILYIQAAFIAKQEYILLEIKVPRELTKSPRAMELFFSGMHQGPGEATFINRNIEGRVRPWWSFELVSTGGRIHFYIWTRKGFKDHIEAQLYAQFPGVEIFEVEDYALKLHFDPSQHNVWGCNFYLTQDDVFPIKTYVEYELDKDPKEELKVDPLAHIFEYLSTLKEGENVWIQIIVRTNKDQRHKDGTWNATEPRWKNEAKEKIKEIKDAATPEVEGPDGTKRKGFMSLSPSDEMRIKAIERSLGKEAFDTGIRGIYWAQKDKFKGTRISGLAGVFKQFGSPHLNGLQPGHYHADFSYPWEEWFGAYDRQTRHVIHQYQLRNWFHPPHQDHHYVMTTEELATLWRFPSRTIEAPGLDRIPAKKVTAPPNLPIE